MQIQIFCARRALLLAAVPVFVFVFDRANAASVTVTNGQTYSTQDQISGTDVVTVNSGGTYQITSKTTSAIEWF